MNNTLTLITNKIWALVVLTALLFVCVWVYKPGLQGEFIFDDIANIDRNHNLHISSLEPDQLWQATWSGHSGPLKRPIPMLTFSIDYYFFDGNPGAMKMVNLLIHLINGGLLFYLIYLLTKSSKITIQPNKLLIIVLFSCSAWLIHPINLTSVLYVVQRMTSMAALFSILSIIFYTLGRRAQQDDKGGWLMILIWCPVFGILALFSKENAILIAYYILCIELFIFQFAAKNIFTQKLIRTLVLTATIVPVASLFLYSVIYPEWILAWYETKEFSLSQRLLTQSQVVVWYMQMIVMPNILEMGLFLEDFELSSSLFNPISTLSSIVLICSLLLAAFLLRSKSPIISLGIAWFFAGHLLESTFLPMEMAFEHRNYLPSIGLLLAVVGTATVVFDHLNKLKRVSYVLAFIWLSALAYSTHARAIHWENSISLALFDAENHPNSSRTNVNAAFAYIQGALSAEDESQKIEYSKKADEYFLKAIELDITGLSTTIGRLVAWYIIGEPIEQKFLQNLKHDLAKRKLDYSTQTALITLKSCHSENICALDNQDLVELFKATISNSDINDEIRASLYIALADHYIWVENDLEEAEMLIKQGIKLDQKELNYRIDLVNIYIGTGQFKLAKEELEKLKSLDKFKFMRYKINKWEDHLNTQVSLVKN